MITKVMILSGALIIGSIAALISDIKHEAYVWVLFWVIIVSIHSLTLWKAMSDKLDELKGETKKPT